MSTGIHGVHHAAADGYASLASTYTRGRPDYPPEVAGWLRDHLGLEAGKTVLDLGAGTGKFTSRLIDTGAQVIAVEPVSGMLEKLATSFPHVDARSGTADAIPLPDASVDAVVCAQSFHWFATHAALAEIHRVLKPGGDFLLILVANDRWAKLAFGPLLSHGGTYGTEWWRDAAATAGFDVREQGTRPVTAYFLLAGR